METETCQNCDGTGQVPKKEALAFPVGAEVHWTETWWRYPNGIDAVVIGHSKGGQRVRIEYMELGRGQVPTGLKLRTYVTPRKLVLRSPVSAQPESADG